MTDVFKANTMKTKKKQNKMLVTFNKLCVGLQYSNSTTEQGFGPI